jgi:hypothetical protein
MCVRIALRRLRKDGKENHQEGLSLKPSKAFVQRPYFKLMDLQVRRRLVPTRSSQQALPDAFHAEDVGRRRDVIARVADGFPCVCLDTPATGQSARMPKAGSVWADGESLFSERAHSNPARAGYGTIFPKPSGFARFGAVDAIAEKSSVWDVVLSRVFGKAATGSRQMGQ